MLSRRFYRGALVATALTLPLLKPENSVNLAVADLFIAVLLLGGAALTMRSEWARRRVRGFSVGFLLIAVGSTLGFSYSGVRAYELLHLTKDAASLAFLSLGMVLVLWACERGHRSVVRAYGVSAVVAVVGLLAARGTTIRTSGTFPHPNLAGHFLATALIFFLFADRSRMRWFLLPMILLGIVLTGSFGAFVQVGAGCLYWMMARRGKGFLGSAVGRVALVGFGAVFILGVVHLSSSSLDTYGLNTHRFDRSSGGREESATVAITLARDNPFGVGAGTVKEELLLPARVEVHNDLLGFIVERTLIGALGLVLVVRHVWRMGQRGGPMRALLISFVVASMFRATLNYRHIPFALALALAVEVSNRKRSERPENALNDVFV